MDSTDKSQIQQSLRELIQSTKFDIDLEVQLLEKNIFNQRMIEKIKSENTNDDKKRELFLRVQTRGPNAFRNLVTALVDSGNHKAALILDPNIIIMPIRMENSCENDKVWNPPTYSQNDNSHVSKPGILDNNTRPLEIKVRKTSNSTCSHIVENDNCYRMDSEPRGLVLIIDNENFEGEVLPTRTGSLVDANNLDILFGDLGFHVTLRRNLSYYELITEVQKFSGKEQWSSVGMCVVVILSHGTHGRVAAADGRELETEWILRQFNNQGCPALKGKPKMFILQACRGDDLDYGVAIKPRLNTTEGDTESDAKALQPASQLEGVVYPCLQVSWEDMLIAYATIPGYVANRDKWRGTWFIESFCSVFMEMAAEKDVREMLDIVASRLKNYESERGAKQSCSYEVRHFYKKLFLNPK